MSANEEIYAYTDFASVYDNFMDNVPYEQWAEHVTSVLKGYGITEGLILDLACGTGTFTRMLSQRGYDMIGIDGSEEMLLIARQESEESNDILYLCQDMREFELYGTVAAVVSVCDSLNYITEPEDLKRVFTLVNNYLESGGYFIFDINSPYKYQNILAGNTFAEDRDDAAFIWDNYYDEAEHINEYALTLFIENEQGSYDKSVELHYERCYEVDEIKQLLEAAGMEFVGAFDGYSYNEVKNNSERILIIAREKRQEGKMYI